MADGAADGGAAGAAAAARASTGGIDPRRRPARRAAVRPGPGGASTARTALLDDVVGAGWRLVTTDPAVAAPLARRRCRLVRRASAARSSTVAAVADVDGTYARWFAEHGVVAVLQRPDFHLFGAAAAADRRRRPARRPARRARPARPRHLAPHPLEEPHEARQPRRPPGPGRRRRRRRRPRRLRRALRPRPGLRLRPSGTTCGRGPARPPATGASARSTSAASARRRPSPARCSPSASTTPATPPSPAWTCPPCPAVFTKYPASLGGPFEPIELSGEMVDWEVELVVVIGRRADRVAEADGWDHVAGLCVGQDVSDRHVQFAAGAQFSLGKSYRTLRPHRPVAGHPRRARRPRRPRPRLLDRRRDRAGRPHQRPRLRRPPAHRRAVRRRAAAARRPDLHRHARRRRHHPQAAAVPPGRRGRSRAGSRASAPSATAVVGTRRR